MPGQVPLQRKPEPARGPADGHAAAHGLNEAPRVAQLAGLGRALNAPKPARVASPVVQAYRRANPDSGTATLHSHAPVPHIRNNHGQREVVYARQQTQSARAQFRVSDDGTVAVHDTTNEPKEFFALNRVVDASNQALEAVKSPVRMRKAGGTVRFGSKTMNRILPELVQPDPQQIGEFPSLWTDVCIELNSRLTGNEGSYREQVVLHDAQSGHSGNITLTPSALGNFKMDRLARNLVDHGDGQPQARIGHALQHSTDQALDQPGGRDYGLALHGGTIDQQSQTLGVNRFVRPEIGEGFATFSIKAQSPSHDYSSGRGQQRTSSWGYHHAAVVARSTDGHDWITLENYNRDPQVEDVIVGEVYRRYQQAANVKLQQLQAKAKRERKPLSKPEARAQVNTYLTTQHEGAQAYYNSLVANKQFAKPSLWHFRMYGSQQGQSFHEEQVRSGAFVNPLTVRVRRDRVRPMRAALVGLRYDLTTGTGNIGWAPSRTVLHTLNGEATNAINAMILLLDNLGENRTDTALNLALAQVDHDYPQWLTATAIPRLTTALRAIKLGPVQTPTTLQELKTQAGLPEPAPGKMRKAGNLLNDWNPLRSNLSTDRGPALAALRTIIDDIPAAL